MTGRSVRRAVLGGVVGLLAPGLVACGGGSDRAAPHTSTTTAVPTPSPSPAAIAERVGSVVPQRPRSIVLPDGDRVPVESVGSRANGVLDVPEDIATAGWWRGGARLGDPFGSTLVAAHVDSVTQGLGPFSSLLGVRPGDKVLVRSHSLRQEYRVRALTLRPRGAIEADNAMFSPLGHRRLTLVTCAGPYDRSRGGYQNLAIIVAYPVSEALHDGRHLRRDPGAS